MSTINDVGYLSALIGENIGKYLEWKLFDQK